MPPRITARGIFRLCVFDAVRENSLLDFRLLIFFRLAMFWVLFVFLSRGLR